jgi:hypothetical protein
MTYKVISISPTFGHYVRETLLGSQRKEGVMQLGEEFGNEKEGVCL